MSLQREMIITTELLFNRIVTKNVRIAHTYTEIQNQVIKIFYSV